MLRCFGMDPLETITVKGILGNTFSLTEKISEGAQGAIYNESTHEYLVKILFEHDESKLNIIESKLKVLYSKKLPSRFIKPLDIVKFQYNNQLYIGYVMKRVKGHISLNKLLHIPDDKNFGDWYNHETGGLKRRLYLGYQIAQSFALLHDHNMAYCDISGNNILVAANPEVNSVCMIDIDNVYTPGTEGNTIIGTNGYIAPEINNHNIKPDFLTDDYSLAVILFELLRCGHPYLGDFIKNKSPEFEQAAYSGHFPYVDDKEDIMNSSSDILPETEVFSSKLQKLFNKTFSEGRKNRMARATAKEFASACLEASNVLLHCKKCSGWFYPLKEHKLEGGGYKCPWCYESSVSLDCFLNLGELYPCVKDSANPGFSTKVKRSFDQSFVLQKGFNFITDNYIYRILTNDNYVEKNDKNFVGGNIKTHFAIQCDETMNHIELIVTDKESIYILRNKQFKEIKPRGRVVLRDKDILYFDKPPQYADYNKLLREVGTTGAIRMAKVCLKNNLEGGRK